MFNYPYMNMARPGLFSRATSLAKGINWSGLLDGTQKTLGVINQAIPVVYQIKPILSNAKTMFRIADSIRGSDTNYSNTTTTSVDTNNTNPSFSTNKPIFYI